MATDFQKDPYWISRGMERELSGDRCLCNLDIKSFRKNKADESYDLILTRSTNNNINNGNSDLSKSLLNVPDRVSVSVEIHNRSFQKPFSSFSKTLMSLETSVCSGTIVKMNGQDIFINLKQKPRRLIQYYFIICKL